MLSTAVGIELNVLSTALDGVPGAYGVNRFGSNVSVAAIPPPIQSTITASAVGATFGPFWAITSLGNPAANAESVAALAVLRKSLRLNRSDISLMMSLFS